MVLAQHEQGLEPLAGVRHGDRHRCRKIEDTHAVGGVEIGADNGLLVDGDWAARMAQLAEATHADGSLHVEIGFGANEIVDVHRLARAQRPGYGGQSTRQHRHFIAPAHHHLPEVTLVFFDAPEG